MLSPADKQNNFTITHPAKEIKTDIAFCVALIALFIFQSDVCAQSSRHRTNTHNAATFTVKKSFRNFSYSVVGGAVSSFNYFGDVAPSPSLISTDLKQTRPAFSVMFEERDGPRFTWRIAFLFGTIKAADSDLSDDGSSTNYRLRRNVSFRNRVQELSATFIFDLIENNSMYFRRPHTPYLIFGLSLMHHNPQAQIPDHGLDGIALANAGEWVNLHDLGTEGQYSKLSTTDTNHGIKPYNLIQPSVPIGFGIRFRVSDVMNVFGELAFRYLFTDYFDDVSQNYVDLGVLDGEVAKALSYRGNEMGPITNPHTYIGRDGISYTVEAGYGAEHLSNVRGNKSDNDVLFLFSIGSSYIFKRHMKAKSR